MRSHLFAKVIYLEGTTMLNSMMYINKK